MTTTTTSGVKANDTGRSQRMNDKLAIVLLGCSLLCSYSLIDINSFLFLPEYVVNGDLHLSKSTAAVMLSFMSAVYAASRGLGIVMATEYKSRSMLLINFPLIGTGCVLLLFFGQTSQLALWLALLLMGTGFGSTFPAVCALLEERINVSDAITGCFLFSSKISSIVLIFVMRPLIDNHPHAFAVANMIGFAGCCIFLPALLLSQHDRTPDQQQDQEDSDPKVIQSRYNRDITYSTRM